MFSSFDFSAVGLELFFSFDVLALSTMFYSYGAIIAAETFLDTSLVSLAVLANLVEPRQLRVDTDKFIININQLKLTINTHPYSIQAYVIIFFCME